MDEIGYVDKLDVAPSVMIVESSDHTYDFLVPDLLTRPRSEAKSEDGQSR